MPRSLERICRKALEADPERRYPTALDMEHALRRFLQRRRILAAGLIVTALIAAMLFVPRRSQRSTDPQREPIPISASPTGETPSSPVTPKIVSFKVVSFRGDPVKPLGLIGVNPMTSTIRFDDCVLVTPPSMHRRTSI